MLKSPYSSALAVSFSAVCPGGDSDLTCTGSRPQRAGSRATRPKKRKPGAPPCHPTLRRPALGRARRSSAAQTDAAIAASARGDALTTTLGYVQRRAALRDITNHI